MGTSSRLSQVFQAARRIAFDNSSRLIFFSDIHRGDNSWADEFARNQAVYTYALHYYDQQGFTYIEVGDGDELSKNARFSTIHYAHSEVFDLLRQFFQAGRLYMLYGNHDISRRDHRIVAETLYHCHDFEIDCEESLLDGIEVLESLVLVHQETRQEWLVVHGHQGGFLTERMTWLAQLLVRRFWRPLQLFGLQDPTSVSWSAERRGRVEARIRRWIETNHIPVICGHTHRPAFPEVGQTPYFNTGSCVHPRWITGLEIDQGQIAQVRWMVQPDSEGIMRIQRKLIAGPKPVTGYQNGTGRPAGEAL